MALAIGIFLTAYIINITIVTVFYHRALAHGAVQLTPFGRFITKHVGVWLTGIDPKGWACMHRLHHSHSDTKGDPHSPVNSSVIGVFFHQHRSFERILAGLIRGRRKYTKVVADIDFDVHWLNRNGLWWFPLVMHFGIGLAVAVLTGQYLIAFAYVAGMSSHPIQGWMVNSFAHTYGYTNFNLGDRSKNNTLIAWLVVGEGYQNNHHRYPRAAKFSVKWWEMDPGYIMVLLMAAIGAIRLSKSDEPSLADMDPELEAAPQA